MLKITPKTLHQEVAQRINEMIRSGELRRGQKINELHLCELVGVSRTPIREALRILNTQGLIDLVPHKGAFVSQFSTQEIHDMFQVMSVLEGMCAELATGKMTDADFRKVEKLHLKLEQHYNSRNHKAYLDTNQVLHTLVQDLAGNAALNEVIKGLRQKILLYRHKQLYEPKRFSESIQEHRDLLEAFRRRDAQIAKDVMKGHLLAQARALVNLIMEGKMDK